MSLPESPGKKDRRLYAKFDIGMDEHAKIMFLSDAAFRALFESTLYSRRQLTDGFLDARIVARKWGAEVVAELTTNDPEKPSWRPVDGGYMIHDYAEHQTTTADIEAKRENGRKGGLAKSKQSLSETEALAKQVLDVSSSKPLAKTETETETETRSDEKTSSKPPALKQSPSRFEQFWEWYPRKVGKAAARKAWDKARTKTDQQNILDGIERYRLDPNLPAKEFIPHPATWLNEGRWDDEPLPMRGQQQRPTGSQNRLQAGYDLLQETRAEMAVQLELGA